MLSTGRAYGAIASRGELPSDFEMPLTSLDSSSFFGGGVELDEALRSHAGDVALSSLHRTPLITSPMHHVAANIADEWAAFTDV
jgi:hypothetical protein